MAVVVVAEMVNIAKIKPTASTGPKHPRNTSKAFGLLGFFTYVMKRNARKALNMPFWFDCLFSLFLF